jgi:molybdopterin converting factor small subunit
MKINIKCSATLSETDHCDYKESRIFDLNEEGADVRSLLSQLNLPEKAVKIIFVNGKQVASNEKLFEGDRVGLFPAVGGM